jgi:tetratricopeptide (TPR) repeat protein
MRARALARTPRRERPPLAARHQPFVDALARARPETPRWLRYRAGLRVLELLDQALSKRAMPVRENRRLDVRDAIRDVRPRAMRMALDGIVDTVAAHGAPPREILGAVDRFAARLEFEGELALATHVYRLIIDVANDERLVELLPEAHRHVAKCLREQGQAADAMTNYLVGHTFAIQLGQEPVAIRIAIDQANLYRVQNRLVEARDILVDALHRAKQFGENDLIARAAHERGLVARRLGLPIDALAYYADAFHAFTKTRGLYRLLNDIALTLFELGLDEAAHDAWLGVYLAAKGEPYARWAAGINLMMLAHRKADEIMFNQHVHALNRAPMPARLLLFYCLECGEGYRVFNRPDESRAAYERAARIARKRGFEKECQIALHALSGSPTLPTRMEVLAVLPPPHVIEFVETIRKRLSLSNLLGDSPRQSLRTVLRRGRPPRLDMR